LIRRVLVVAPHLGELTPFANALAELGARGCHVHLAVEDDPPPGVDVSVFAGRFRRLTIGPAPRIEASSILGSTIRSALDARPDRPTTAAVLSAIDRLLPPPAAVVDFVRAFSPELLVVSSLFTHGSTAPDYLRAAQVLKVATFGMPVRWDDLTRGARLHVVPDCVALWNREDRRRAIDECGVQARRTAVIGVPLPLDVLGAIKTTREQFCERHGLDPARAVVLFAPHGSDDRRRAAFTAWLASVRSSSDCRVREAQVLVHWSPPGGVRQRRHPDIPDAVVVPRKDSDPTWYRFDVAEALHHADAVVVTDMTLVLEAATRTRPVFPLLWEDDRDEELARFSAEPSFRGAWLLPSATADQHLQQLARILTVGLAAPDRIAIRSRVRPHGPDLSPGFLMAARLFQEVVDRRANAPAPRAWALRRALLAPAAAFAAWRSAGQPARALPGARVRILVAVPGAEALYLHQPLLRELVERGHRVRILFTARRSQTADVYARIRCDIPGVSTAGTLMPGDGFWSSLGRGLLGLSAFSMMVEGRQTKPAPRWQARYAFMVLPAGMRRLAARLTRVGSGAPARLRRFAARLDRAIAPSRTALSWIGNERPHAVVVLPEPDFVSAFDSAESQADLIRASSVLAIPTIAVAISADAQLLATMLQPGPSHALVWQKQQTGAIADVVRQDRVASTGAALFDRGLDEPSVVGPDEFRQMMGLPPTRPFALYVGSSGLLIDVDAEIALVRGWVRRLRRHDDPALRELTVLVRPSPGRASRWQNADLGARDDVVVAPPGYDRAGELNMVLLAESVRYSAVTVGSDGHALIMAAALGRPAVAVTGADGGAQAATVHPLAFLWNGSRGSVRTAATVDELIAQVHDVIHGLSGPAPREESLVRPTRGAKPSQTAADLIESIAQSGGQRGRPRASLARQAMRVPLLAGAAVVAVLAPLERSK
jgi:hypothetical protein